MNAAQIHSTFKTSLQYLLAGRLNNAFEKTSLMVDELQIGEYADKLADLTQNYQFLLNYFKEGIPDPQRKSVYNKLVARSYILTNELCEELMMRNSSNYEYTQKRYFPYTRKYRTPSELLISLRYFHSQWALLSALSDTHEAELKRLRQNYETALHELFCIFWLSTRLQNEEKTVCAAVMADSYPGWQEQTLIVSALMLNLWRMFDESKMSLLFDFCQHTDARVKQRALVALCFVLARHNRFLTYFPAIRNRLVLLSDDHHVVENFRNIFIQIISTAETDKISKKMKEEILPEVMKFSPKMKDKSDPDSLQNPDEWNEENPEWQELLDSEVADKLKELSDLQQEGADVYMGTFSMLKTFPFFSVLSNWFLPFDAGNSVIHELFRSDDQVLVSAFVRNNLMCNSDKYSFCLSILHMPESQRSLLKQSFKMEAEQMDEMAKEEALLNSDLAAKNITKQYIQDLFRFFKLYPQHQDFQDMFESSLRLHRTYLYDILAGNDNFKESLSEYYFSKSHYEEALEVYRQLEAAHLVNAAMYQKIGFSYQQLADYAAALVAYRKADIIQPDDVWTLRKMALCSRMTGDYSTALDYYLHLDYLKPSQKSIQMQIGHCYMELQKFKEALALFFKLDALEDEDVRVWRSISWCSFAVANLAQADYYMTKILQHSATASDYLNAGHIAWCQGKVAEAVTLYQQSIELSEGDFDAFLAVLTEDKRFLYANGVGSDDIALLLDILNGWKG